MFCAAAHRARGSLSAYSVAQPAAEDRSSWPRKPPHNPTRRIFMTLGLTPLVALLAGVLILIVPRMLNYIVAAYLIVIGVLGLVGDVHFK
jgi:Protein of unknown function (DUF3096)